MDLQLMNACSQAELAHGGPFGPCYKSSVLIVGVRMRARERIKDLKDAYLTIVTTILLPLFSYDFFFLYFQIDPVHFLNISIKSPQEIEDEVSSNMLR